jgi:hypothetical protein
MIEFTCPCGRRLRARDEDVGRQTKCPVCAEVSVVPSESVADTQKLGPDEDRPPRDKVTPGRPEGGRAGARRGRDDEDDREDDRPRRRRSQEKEGTSGKATASMILGLISFPFCIGSILTGIPAIILGALALSDIGKSDGRLGGKGLAITGLVTGALSLLMIPILIGLLLPAVQKVREAATRAQDANNMKQMALAMYNFESTYTGLPRSGAFLTKDGKPGLSWRVAILPFVEQDALFKRFKLDEAWDGPTNKPLLGLMPKLYLRPGDANDGSGLTHYQVFVGPGAVFDDRFKRPGGAGPGGLNIPGQVQLGVRIPEITDGASNTLLIVSGQKAVPWTKPEDLPFDPTLPLPPLGDPQRSGYNVGMADCSIRFIPRGTPDNVLKPAITRAGNEPVMLP